jgi:hypothetical protein
MRKTVTTYTCDGCGKKADNYRDLRPFTIVLNRRGSGWIFGDDAWADLCDECEGRLIAAVEPLLGSGVVALRRENDEARKTKSRKRARR